MSKATQDAQLAKQAKQQIAYNAAKADERHAANVAAARKAGKKAYAPGQYDAPKPVAQRAKNITKAKRAEAKAAEANDKVLAARKAKPVEPKPLAKGSGALIGVAKGAMDGQPHTKRAVEEARKAARAPYLRDLSLDDRKAALRTKAAGKVEARMGKATVWVASDDPWLVNGEVYGNDTRAAEARKPVEAAAPKATPKAPAAPKADRTYKATDKAVDAKAGSWRHYMLTMIMAHTSVSAAKAAHAASGQFAGNALDFNWTAKQGWIAFA